MQEEASAHVGKDSLACRHPLALRCHWVEPMPVGARAPPMTTQPSRRQLAGGGVALTF